LFCDEVNPVTYHDGEQAAVERVRKLSAFAEQLEAYVSGFRVALFDEDPDIIVFRIVHGGLIQ
jgi:hypothetical protein